MRFHPSEDQQQVFETVRTFALSQADGGARRAAVENGGEFDPALWRELISMGVAGLAAPEASGGLGLGLFDLTLAAEAIGYAALPGPFLGHVLTIEALQSCGSEDQRQRWLGPLVRGELVGTIAFSEAGERHRPSEWTSTVLGRKLTGEKNNVLHPEVADLMLVGVDGGFATVERGASGVTIHPSRSADLTRRSGGVSFAAAPADPMPADPAKTRRLFDTALALLAADAFGGATRLLEMTVDYVKFREQFGGPVGRFQGLKHQLADSAVDVEPARGLYWYAAYVLEKVSPDASRVAALAKAHLAEVFMRMAQRAVESHGGIGFTWEHDVQIWYKRALFDFAFLGSPSEHREQAAQLAGW